MRPGRLPVKVFLPHNTGRRPRAEVTLGGLLIPSGLGTPGHTQKTHMSKTFSLPVFSRGGGPAAGSGSSGGSGAEPVPRAAAGAQEPVGPGAELCVLAALRGG